MPEHEDATRRTRLANERTYLAWWRTGLTAFAVSLGTGRLLPALTKGPVWPYTVVGVGFALLGVAFVAYAFWRHRRVEDAVAAGRYARVEDEFLVAATIAGVVLGLAVVAITLAES
jgi:putative membrane protein